MKHLFFTLFSCTFLFAACKKNNDEIKEGDKAKISVANFVINDFPVDISINDQKLTSSPINYGNITGTSDSSIYLPFTPGFCNVKLSEAGVDSINLLGNKSNFVFGSATPFTFFLFGDKTQAYTYVVQDNIQPVDTTAKGRFFNFIPGTDKDSLNVYLIRNNRLTGIRDTFYVAKTKVFEQYEKSDNSPFNIAIPSDSFRIHIYNRSTFIDSSSYVITDIKKVYSFYAIGAYNETGTYKPRIKIVRHN